MNLLVDPTYQADLKNAMTDKKQLWTAIISNGQIVKKFNVSAKTINSALSKSSKYMKDSGHKDYRLLGIESIAVIDY